MLFLSCPPAHRIHFLVWNPRCWVALLTTICTFFSLISSCSSKVKRFIAAINKDCKTCEGEDLRSVSVVIWTLILLLLLLLLLPHTTVTLLLVVSSNHLGNISAYHPWKKHNPSHEDSNSCAVDLVAFTFCAYSDVHLSVQFRLFLLMHNINCCHKM